MFEMIFNTHYDSPWAHLDNDEPMHRPFDPLSELHALFFDLDGRIGRLAWLVGSVVWSVALVVFWIAAALAYGDVGLKMAMVASVVPFTWARLALDVKRWHDLGYSGWMVFITFLPLGNLVQLGMLGLLPSDGPNAWTREVLDRVY